MTPDLFCRIGEALYGANWKGAMADDLQIGLRTIQRWASGENAIPNHVKSPLSGLIYGMEDRLRALRNTLETGEN